MEYPQSRLNDPFADREASLNLDFRSRGYSPLTPKVVTRDGLDTCITGLTKRLRATPGDSLRFAAEAICFPVIYLLNRGSQSLYRLVPRMKTIILLIVSNIFMTAAWYGHLKYKDKPLVWVILLSWSVALFEYIFQVPANRIGSQTFSLMQLKIMQECITLVVFTVMAYFLFGQTLKWNNLVSYAFIVGAVYFSFAF